MQRKRTRHLLVMEGDRLVGIVTELLYGHPPEPTLPAEVSPAVHKNKASGQGRETTAQPKEEEDNG
jgi:hypothetical protein